MGDDTEAKDHAGKNASTNDKKDKSDNDQDKDQPYNAFVPPYNSNATAKKAEVQELNSSFAPHMLADNRQEESADAHHPSGISAYKKNVAMLNPRQPPGKAPSSRSTPKAFSVNEQPRLFARQQDPKGTKPKQMSMAADPPTGNPNQTQTQIQSQWTSASKRPNRSLNPIPKARMNQRPNSRPLK